MRSELNRAQVESYRENGFLVIDDFLDENEVDHLRTILTDAVRARGVARVPSEIPRPVPVPAGAAAAEPTESIQDGAPAVTDQHRGRRLIDALSKHRRSWTRVLSQYVNLWQTDERVREFCLDPRLGRVACELGEVDGIRMWHDQTMVKPPWGEPTAWHMDTPAFSFTHPGTSTFWFALVDADLQNGCMYYLPGSHKVRAGTGGNMRLDGLRLLHPGWELAEPKPCPVRAGAMIVHNGDTAHAAGANMTPYPRSAYAISWMPAGSTFNGRPNILPADILATLRIGDSLDIEHQCPLVYRRRP
jgi:ectoine hydroxylase-related dioxygenase (phytanoyl-CoA dioxygenase family)